MKRQGATKHDHIEGVPCYFKLTEKNQQFIDREIVKTGHYKATVLNAIIQSVRTGKPYTLQKRDMLALARVKQQHENRLSKHKK